MQSKKEFAAQRINELLDAVLAREQLSTQAVADLGFVRFYVKELTGCECEDQKETPSGSQSEK